MSDSDISEYITFKKQSGETLKIYQKYVGIKARPDRTMAIHYKAPIENAIELEKFFENFSTIEKLKMDIGDTGFIGVNYRGLIAGKDKNLPEDYDYQVLLVEEFKCPKKEEYKNIKHMSRFRNKLAEPE
jgi:hypothetical protein